MEVLSWHCPNIDRVNPCSSAGSAIPADENLRTTALSQLGSSVRTGGLVLGPCVERGRCREAL